MSHARYLLRRIEGSLSYSGEFPDLDDDEPHDLNQNLVDSDDDNAEHLSDTDASDESLSFAAFEEQQREKRAALTSQGLGALPRRPIAPSEHAFVGVSQSTNSASAIRPNRSVVLQPPLVADDSVRWLPVSLGGVLKQRRVGCAATSIVDLSGREPSIGVLFGGNYEDGRAAGDGAMVSADLAVTALSSKAGKPNKEQTKRRFAAKAAGLTAHTITHCNSTDTLVVIGGMRHNVRQKSIFFLNAPRSPTATWGAPHKGNPCLRDLFVNVRSLHHRSSFMFCTCDRSMNTRQYDVVDEALLEPHFGVPDMPHALPAISHHVSVAVGGMVVSFGGKGADGDAFADVLVVQGSPQGTATKARRCHFSHGFFEYRFLSQTVGFQRHSVTLAAYQPTTGSAAVALGSRAFVIGGRNKAGEPINAIFEFDPHSGAMNLFLISVGRLPPLASHSATMVHDTAIVCGGVSAANHRLSNVFMINLTKHTCTELVVTQGIPPSPRVRHSVCAVGRDLLIFGGDLESGATDDCVLLRGIADMREARATVHDFGWLLKSAQFADVDIVSGGEPLRVAHRIVLAARSALLRELMDGASATERVRQLASGRTVSCALQTDGKLRLTFAEAPSAVEAMIHFLYTDGVDIQNCDVDVLARVATDFELHGLVRMCESLSDVSVVIPTSTFIADFRACIDNALCCDVTFVVDGHHVRAHRALLARCEFFAMLLGGQFREASQHTVPIVDIEHEVFIAGITYLYTGVLDSRNAQMLFELLYVSNFWNLPDLKNTLEPLLLPFSNAETCALFFEAAHENNCSDTFKRTITEHVKRFYFAAISGAADTGEEEVQQLLAVLEAARIDASGDDRRDPVTEGWIPRGGISRCSACSRPLIYDPRTWPVSQLLPTLALEKWSAKSNVQPVFVVVPPGEGDVGFRTDVELPHLPEHQARVQVLHRFATQKLARQNAALFALHHVHTCAE